ncbi:uncharacterized protein EDB91DRAFT_1206817 [Suillus paluster]|uniref:uncharacterized protein n=1 Tax=Suillus paluster TaxID=48578 RepID=UPI001B86A80F|nr:uncharacterized protein EDB91DRAFT_1206817 [Suillus paluster]KAG1730969.1 hypothetical protein EDB91DRAFT_1206817 [Suillus paluster]
MSSKTPQTDLSLERSRLNGMVLGGVSYGVFFLLTVQAWIALMQQPRFEGKIASHRRALLFYIFITFVLRTISFAANAKYTEMIWIDLRDAPSGPAALIEHDMDYRINVVTMFTGPIQEWFMQALLLHRCFVIWDWARCVMIPMIALYVTMIALSIFCLIQASTGAVLYNVNIILVYLCFQVGITVIYTILVVNRLLAMRNKMKQSMTQYNSGTYDTIAIMVIESSMLYTAFAMIFIVAFALHLNNVTTVCFLSISSIQGISQLFIILRVARGRAVTHEWSTPVTAVPMSVGLAGSVLDTTEKSNHGRIDRPE